MDAILNFKEAAKALQSDEIYLALESARNANDKDAELQDLIGQFNLERLALDAEMGKDESDEAKLDLLNQKIQGIYTAIMQNPNMMAYNKAKHDIQQFMEYVNAILNAAIDGQDPMLVEEPQEHDCCSSGGCSSCSGCG